MSKLKITLVSVLCLIVLLGLSLAFGWFNVFFKNTVGVANATADRNIFEQGKSYTQGMISDLANYKYEYETSTDETARKAIKNLIRDKFANFDAEKIENYSLRQFLIGILNNN